MACETCRSHVRSVLRAAVTASRTPTIQASTSAAASRRYFSSTTGRDATPQLLPRQQRRQQQSTGQARSFSNTIPSRLMGNALSSQPYFVIESTKRLFNLCGSQASYEISEKLREEEGVNKLDDGEEVGKSTASDAFWHKKLKLAPTFSTWSHVTMLYLYLLNARIRQFDRESYRHWQQQLVDHFFFEAERKMHVDHQITSSALRQRYLKDIFVQWRGLQLAYDEGLVKGDAILASAIWRNLFKGDPEVNPIALASIVGWMRATLVALEATPDYSLPSRATAILNVDIMTFWKTLEKRCGASSPVLDDAEGEYMTQDTEGGSQKPDIDELSKPVTPVAAEAAKP